MAAGGKRNKTNWKPVDIFIDTTRKNTSSEIVLDANRISWEDEVVKEMDGSSSHLLDSRVPHKVELPTAPRASRGSAFDESKIPLVGPFQAYISNIPFELNEDELMDVFKDLKVKSVRLPREEKTSKAKGYGYIEFEDRNSLSAALSLGDTMLKGRVMKIDIPNNDGGRGGMRGRSNRDGGRDQTSSDRTSGNWRSGPRQDDFSEDRGYDRGGYGRRDFGGAGGGGGGGSGFSRGGFDREERGFNREERDRFDRGKEDRGRDDRGGSGFRDRYEKDRGFGGGRDREGYDRGFRERGREDDRFSRNDDRGGSGGGSGHWRDEQAPRERDRDRGFGGGRGGFEDRRDRDRDGGGKFGPRRDDPPMDRDFVSQGGGESRNRPKLQLQPRTKPKEATPDSPSTTATASASIFGGAKPVDTAAREREIEERLMKSEDFADSKSKSGPSSSGSGSQRSERQWEPPERRVEPAPPPKENPWGRKPPQTIINNGRSSPDEGSRTDSADRDEKRGEGPGRRQGQDSAEKPRGIDSERHVSKPRERKEECIDDISKMPRVPESKTPNFAASNKYSSLVDSDETTNE